MKKLQKLLKNKKFVIPASIVILFLGGLIIAFQCGVYTTLKQMSLKDTTPTQMAAAMREDEFWSSYRFNTVVFDGKVKSKNIVNDITTFALVTSDTYGASCDFTNQNTDLIIGRTYKFAAVAYRAERQPNSVLLYDCIIL